MRRHACLAGCRATVINYSVAWPELARVPRAFLDTNATYSDLFVIGKHALSARRWCSLLAPRFSQKPGEGSPPILASSTAAGGLWPEPAQRLRHRLRRRGAFPTRAPSLICLKCGFVLTIELQCSCWAEPEFVRVSLPSLGPNATYSAPRARASATALTDQTVTSRREGFQRHLISRACR